MYGTVKFTLDICYQNYCLGVAQDLNTVVVAAHLYNAARSK